MFFKKFKKYRIETLSLVSTEMRDFLREAQKKVKKNVKETVLKPLNSKESEKLLNQISIRTEK